MINEPKQEQHTFIKIIKDKLNSTNNFYVIVLFMASQKPQVSVSLLTYVHFRTTMTWAQRCNDIYASMYSSIHPTLNSIHPGR